MYPLEEINLSGEAAVDYAYYLLELNRRLITETTNNSDKLHKNDIFRIDMIPKLFDTFYFQRMSQDFSASFYSKRLGEISSVIVNACEQEVKILFEKRKCMLFEKQATIVFDDIASIIGSKKAVEKYEKDEPAIPQRKVDRAYHNLCILSDKVKNKINNEEFCQFKKFVIGKNNRDALKLTSILKEDPSSERFKILAKNVYENNLREINEWRKDYYEKMASFNIDMAEVMCNAKLKKEYPKERKHTSIAINGQENMFSSDDKNGNA
ncbi:MAG: hypothetical protein WCR30_05155 [Clostridia bacterium]